MLYKQSDSIKVCPQRRKLDDDKENDTKVDGNRNTPDSKEKISATLS